MNAAAPAPVAICILFANIACTAAVVLANFETVSLPTSSNGGGVK